MPPRERFANAADFTYFIVGAFSVPEITPLTGSIARPVGRPVAE